MDTFIMLKRSDETLALIANPNAFALLTMIAIRARRTDIFNVHGLKAGEAFIGDYANCGLTRQQYRTALANLQRWEFITTKSTNKGTIATLANTKVYDINQDDSNQQTNQPTTNKTPSNNHQTTTNNNDNNANNEKNANNNYVAVKDYWNSKPNLPTVRTLTPKRNLQLKTRLSEEQFSTRWKEIIDKIDASAFCTGANSNGWKAGFDWIIKNQDNYTKVLEGNYDERTAISTNQQKPKSITAETSKIGLVLTND